MFLVCCFAGLVFGLGYLVAALCVAVCFGNGGWWFWILCRLVCFVWCVAALVDLWCFVLRVGAVILVVVG